MEKHGFLKVAGNKVVDQPLDWMSAKKRSVSGDEKHPRSSDGFDFLGFDIFCSYMLSYSFTLFFHVLLCGSHIVETGLASQCDFVACRSFGLNGSRNSGRKAPRLDT